MENDDTEIDINKILADAEEKSKLAAKEFEKAADTIAKKFSLDENHSYNIYDYQGLCFVDLSKLEIELFQAKIGKVSKIENELKGNKLLNCLKENGSKQTTT